MEIQTWLLLTERTVNFTKTDARIAIAGVTILVYLNSMHLPFDQCAIQIKLPNLRILFFKISLKPYQRPIKNEKKIRKVQRTESKFESFSSNESSFF